MAGIGGTVGKSMQGDGQSSGQMYRGPFAFMKILFFMWGFMFCFVGKQITIPGMWRIYNLVGIRQLSMSSQYFNNRF